MEESLSEGRKGELRTAALEEEVGSGSVGPETAGCTEGVEVACFETGPAEAESLDSARARTVAGSSG